MRIVARGEYNSLENISFSSKITDWPSLTCAELSAIWIVLLAAPYNSKINIFSDSKAAIESIQNNKSTISLCKLFKTKNRSLIRQIEDCYKAKGLELNLIKVKGHSKDFWNYRADSLIKEGLNSNKAIRVDDINTNSLRVIPR